MALSTEDRKVEETSSESLNTLPVLISTESVETDLDASLASPSFPSQP